MSLLERYRTGAGAAYDELVTGDGGLRPGWEALGLDAWDAAELRSARGLAARLLEDDGVTYNPLPRGATELPAGPERWRLDPLPALVDAADWARLERGVGQRSELLEAVLADLYGERRLVADGLVPPELLWRWAGYQRPAWGAHPTGRAPRLVLTATDVGRGPDGDWHVVADRTQAPSGLGYAMANRRVVARLLPDAYRTSDPHRLTSFFNQVREALLDVAPLVVEDPRVVVLTPGRHSETAFDHAYIASLLGFPLVTGGDLVMREGRVWMRELGALRPVDVVIRRVDDTWCDPLELRPDSELGVPGLMEACRRGTVGLANAFGAGVVESAGFARLLPRLCETVLGESLRLPSAASWWCGEPGGLSHVLANLERLVLRPVTRARGRSVHGPSLGAAELERWRTRVAAEPGAFVGQELLPLSTTPTVGAAGLAARPLTLRAFAVARDGAYRVMPGALGRIAPDASGVPRETDAGPVALSKDVWVGKGLPEAAAPRGPAAVELLPPRRAAVAMVPRALEDLYWFGRYAERAEDVTRLLLALRALADDFPFGGSEPGHAAVDVLARTLTHVTGTYPGLAGTGRSAGGALAAEMRSLLLDRGRQGSVAQSLDGLAGAARSVRDQLSADVFMVLGSLERACAQLAQSRPADTGALVDTGVSVLSGTLALAGITAENMIRDVGWQLLDLGRGVERALQTTVLLRWSVGLTRPPPVEAAVVSVVLTAAESVVTHRRRYARAQRVETMLDLLLVDGGNPRSVAFQVERLRHGIAALPGSSAAGRLARLADEVAGDLGMVDSRRLATAATDTAVREDLVGLCALLEGRFRALSEALADTYFWHPSAPRPLGAPSPVPPGLGQVAG